MVSRKRNDDTFYLSSKNNPCLREHQLSLKCLGENNYIHKPCEQYFDNYNNCKEFWNEVQSSRRRNGITPQLPEFEERAKIKKEYMKSQIQ